MSQAGIISFSNGPLPPGDQVAFLVFPSEDITNATGAGQVVIIDFDSKVFDIGDNFSGQNFTAPVTGLYQFNMTISCDEITALMTNSEFSLAVTGKAYVFGKLNIAAASDATSAAYTASGSALVQLNSGDEAQIQVVIANGIGNTASIIGDNAGYWTHFSGYLVS